MNAPAYTLPSEQITGVTSREAEPTPATYERDQQGEQHADAQYVELPAHDDEDIEAHLHRNLSRGATDIPDDPPAYTPTPTSTSTSTSMQQKPESEVVAQVNELNADFSSLPLLQTHNSVIDRDLAELSSALTSIKMGDSGARFAAKRAGKQLVRDIWEMEQERIRERREAHEMARGGGCCGKGRGPGGMSRDERKMIKEQMKEVKKLVKEEVKAKRRH